MSLQLSLLCVGLLSARVQGFVPHRSWAPRLSLLLQASPVDDARAAAEAASSKFGVASDEAKTAWEVVDELENGNKSGRKMTSLEDECDPSDDEKCIEYNKRMQELETLMSQAKNVNEQIQVKLADIRDIKLASNEISEGSIDENAYNVAKTEAEAAAAKFGSDSREARAAWDAVYEIESASERVNTASLDDECLVSSSEKCIEYQAALASLAAELEKAKATP